MLRHSQQVRVGELLMALQRGFQAANCCRNLEACRPELMSVMREILGEQRDGFLRRKGVTRESRVGYDPHEAELRQRCRGPLTGWCAL